MPKDSASRGEGPGRHGPRLRVAVIAHSRRWGAERPLRRGLVRAGRSAALVVDNRRAPDPVRSRGAGRAFVLGRHTMERCIHDLRRDLPFGNPVAVEPAA
jgi:hypothetical protein